MGLSTRRKKYGRNRKEITEQKEKREIEEIIERK